MCKLKTMSKLTMHTRCLTECQGHLGNSWDGQKLQIIVSLDDKEGGKVSLSKTKTCQCKFLRKPNLDRKKRALLHVLKILQWAQSPELKGLVEWSLSKRKIMGTRAKQNRVAVENTQLDQREKEDDLLKFFKELQWVFT